MPDNVDAVVFYFHGSSQSFSFYDKNTSNWAQDKDGNSLKFTIGDISSLQNKNVKLFVSMACLTGQTGITNSATGKVQNMATELIRNISGIQNLIAADANVATNIISKTITKTFLGIPIYSYKKSYVSITTTKPTNAQGFKLYTRNSTGEIITSSVGGYGYKFQGITDIINTALKK